MESFSQTAEDRLEESVLQSGSSGHEAYPERPGEADCHFYLRTGTCGYGVRCRFNHPRDSLAAVGQVWSASNYPERIGQPLCQYYLKTRTCKFGATCKYHHPKEGGGHLGPMQLNYHGYPLRPGEQECAYYLKMGKCKFGETCKFHHPQPTSISMSASAPAFYPTLGPPPLSSQQYGSTSWQIARPPALSGSYVTGPYSPTVIPPGVVSYSNWSSYLASLSPFQSPSLQHPSGGNTVYGLTHQLPSSAPVFVGQYPLLSSSVELPSSIPNRPLLPERPGQPECQFYMKTGDCRFGITCKYHHPPDRKVHRTNPPLNPMGLPLRPGAQPCTFFAQHGVCKFGPSCKYDHPIGTMSYSPSASSLSDMPVAPYPIGSSMVTLAPSSSSDFQREISSTKDSFSIKVQHSEITPSGSLGSIFSHGRTIPYSQQQPVSSGVSSGIEDQQDRDS